MSSYRCDIVLPIVVCSLYTYSAKTFPDNVDVGRTRFIGHHLRDNLDCLDWVDLQNVLVSGAIAKSLDIVVECRCIPFSDGDLAVVHEDEKFHLTVALNKLVSCELCCSRMLQDDVSMA